MNHITRYKKYLIIFSWFLISLASADIITKIKELFTTYSQPKPTIVKAVGSIEVAFSPNNGASQQIINAINQAKTKILVEAYSFTSKDIAKALLRAKTRGIQIKIILDKSQVAQKYSSSTFFSNQNFDLKIDYQHAIFHNKVMIIDDKTVITGSFNFTRAAETKNAENVLILRDNPELTKLYTQEFNYLWSKALSKNEFILRFPAKTQHD